MPMAFKKGNFVRQVAPVISGPIVDVAIVDGEVQYAVEYEQDGEVHTRFFAEAQLEAMPDEGTPLNPEA